MGVMILIYCACLPNAVQAQNTNDKPVAASLPNVLQDGTLPVQAELYLRDGNGTPILVPNVTIDELVKSRAQVAGIGGANFAPFEFESIQVTATIKEGFAEVEGAFKVRLGPGNQSADIPLSFSSCQLGLAPPEFVSSDPEVVHQLNVDATGYRCLIWSKAQAKESHSITLRGKTRITQESDRRSLHIALPNFPCVVKVLLPPNAIDERVRNENVLQRESNEQGVSLTINSRGGDFSVSWRVREAIMRVASVEAHSTTTFEIGDPRQVWEATTSLKVRWYGNDGAAQFRVQLPHGARWRVFPPSDYERYIITSVAPQDPEKVNVGASAVQSDSFAEPVELLIENLDQAQTQLIDLELKWEWKPKEHGKETFEMETQIPAPTILGVDSHRGLIDCYYPAAFSAVFTKGEGAQLNQGRAADVFGRQRLQLGFIRQPFNLAVAFRSEQSLPTVRPTYQVAVDKNKLVMTAWLDCSFDENQPLRLGLVFGDWILQENTAKALNNPNDLFTADGDGLRVTAEEDGNYTVTGTDSSPSSFGTNRRVDQVWRLVAERSWTPDEDNELEFRVPEIIRGSEPADHGSGALIVTHEDNILIQWKEAPFTGLLSDSFSTDYQRYVNRESIRQPLAFRFQGRGTTPTWAGTAELLPQAITLQEQIELQVFDSELVISQEFDLQVRNEPLKQVQIAVRSDARRVEPQFLVNGISTSAKLVATMNAAELAAKTLQSAVAVSDPTSESKSETVDAVQTLWNVYELVGAPELIGNSQISVVSSKSWQASPNTNAVPAPAAGTEAATIPNNQLTTTLTVPLAKPILPTGRMLRRSLRLKSELQVELGGANVTSSAIRFNSASESRQLNPQDETVQLLVRQKLVGEGQSLIRVGASWLQTAISGTQRRDRFVARITTAADRLNVKLPPLAAVIKYQVVMDGLLRSDAVYDSATDMLVIRLPPSEIEQPHTLEIFYSVRVNLASLTALEVSAPQIAGAESSDRFYWQLATPATQHLGWSPLELTPEWRWNWGGWWWFRKSVYDEQALISKLKAIETDEDLLPVSANQYLMSGRGAIGSFRVWVISRYVLWLPVGTLAILLSTLIIHFPFFRHPLFGFALSGIVVTLAMLFPDLGVLLGQTAVISLGLVVIVFTTQAAIESRVRRRSVFSVRPSTQIDGSDHHSGAKSERANQLALGSSIVANGGN